MISSLTENNYLVIPGFIEFERAIKLSKEFNSYCEKNQLPGDKQVENSSAKYDYISFLELLCEKTPEVSKIIGETVLPTYSYARVYRRGNELPIHTDRQACEISLTLNLDCDTPWDIWINTPNGEDRCVTLRPGDAMIYLGCVASHWRNQFIGNYCTQVFMHYVRSRGPYFNAYFDKKEYKTNSDILEDSITKDFVQVVEDTTIKSPTLIVKNEETITYKSKTPLDDYIKIFYGIIPDETCDLILSEYSNSNEWTSSRTGDGQINKDIRNCDIISLSQANTINNNPETRQKIDHLLFNASGSALKNYIELFPNCEVNTDSGYDLLRYQTNGYYSLHTDSFKDIPRSVSCSFNLNDDYEGGEFAFFDREMVIRAPKGSAIVFPSNFMYPHEIMEVKSGTRYSVVTWFI
jgi:predicted 2-oxoglutarate/Fe(II)-dependent dioxygenase YbiX